MVAAWKTARRTLGLAGATIATRHKGHALLNRMDRYAYLKPWPSELSVRDHIQGQAAVDSSACFIV
jgi:hypothetical protein